MLSIIIPTLNEEDYLHCLLSSIKKQSLRDYEVIIADANSQDNTRKIAEKWGCKIVVGGLPAKGRNEGARQAQGNLFLFLDADVVLPNKKFLETIVNEFENRSLDIASCFSCPLNKKFFDKILYFFGHIYFNICQYFWPHALGFCILVKREIHRKINGFDETLKLSEDHDYVQRASKFGKFRFLQAEKILVSKRRVEEEGVPRLFFKYLFSEIYMLFFKKIKSLPFSYQFGKHKKI